MARDKGTSVYVGRDLRDQLLRPIAAEREAAGRTDTSWAVITREALEFFCREKYAHLRYQYTADSGEEGGA